MYRCRHSYVARYDDYSCIVQKCGILRSECIVAKCRVTAEMWLDPGRVFSNRPLQVGYHQVTFCIDNWPGSGQLRRIDTINKHQSASRFFNEKVRDIGQFQMRSRQIARCMASGWWISAVNSGCVLNLGVQPVKCLTSLIGSAHVFSVVTERSL